MKLGVLLGIVDVASVDVGIAVRARDQKLWHVWVVEMIERHHGRVLGAAQLVELVMVPLAQVEKLLPRVVKLGFDDLVRVQRLVKGQVERRDGARSLRRFDLDVLGRLVGPCRIDVGGLLGGLLERRGRVGCRIALIFWRGVGRRGKVASFARWHRAVFSRFGNVVHSVFIFNRLDAVCRLAAVCRRRLDAVCPRHGKGFGRIVADGLRRCIFNFGGHVQAFPDRPRLGQSDDAARHEVRHDERVLHRLQDLAHALQQAVLNAVEREAVAPSLSGAAAGALGL
mmetsp:Transcript_32202/g.113377  ORF Transcript_32202/g.113377 Transcript_32202/m.113377 type:complete len:283 (-) Transcript_32202:1858-2706(-)